MNRHAPDGYACPFCAVVAGEETALNAQTDVVLREATTTALVCPKWWKAAPGHALVIPNEHYENVYSIPRSALADVYATAQRVAHAIRAARGCDGTSMRQHNEPGGGQDVWHFHVHVFPRRPGHRLYERNAETFWPSPEERTAVADKICAALRSAAFDDGA